MEKERTRILLLCGGRSTEHEISIVSCLSVANAVDRTRFAPMVVGITRDGIWRYYGDGPFAKGEDSARTVHLREGAPACFPVPVPNGAALRIEGREETVPFEAAFPVLHGAFGEDGTIQGLFAMLSVPCVGCGVAASAVCMDKEATKAILEHAGFRTARAVVIRRDDVYGAEDIVNRLGLPFFVKPARTGSSVGISKVRKADDLEAAVEAAFRYDDKVLLEEGIRGREIECGVLEYPDGRLFAARPGEVIPHADFYSYDAKYLDENGASVVPQAALSETQSRRVRELAVAAFRCLGCGGMARIDFFLTPEGEWVLNEVNTIPGFTSISLYPRMMGGSGVDYAELITLLIENAIRRQQRRCCAEV